jgi:hypothetical protein
VDSPQEKRGLDSPRSVNRIWRGLWIVCLLLVALDVGGVLYHKHPHFAFEGIWGFHGWFGFLAFAGLVFAGMLWRKVVGRGEDYYDR